MTGVYTVPAPYFFLSYARSDPLAGNPGEDPDKLVEEFFYDLTSAVRMQSSSVDNAFPGFIDRNIPVESDWKEFTTRALSAAQVFVPLYSVAYVTKSWPGRELTCFKNRVTQASREDPVHRMVPVLWAPLPGQQDPPGLRESLSLSVTEPDYAVNGLLALLRREPYHDKYWAVVTQLAARIVELAERDPIEPVEPSQVGDIEKALSEFPPERKLPVFSIEVAALSAASAPGGTDPRTYGETPEEWRPFVGQQQPLAEYARQLTARFDFNVHVSPARLGLKKDERRPGILVIDPGFIANGDGADRLKEIAKTLPRWVLPLVILPSDDIRTRELAAGVLDILTIAKALPTERSSRAAHGVNSLDEFVSIIPVLVAEAERQYFRYRRSPILPPAEGGRPSLAHPEGPE
jgi:FxsC-like protein